MDLPNPGRHEPRLQQRDHVTGIKPWKYALSKQELSESDPDYIQYAGITLLYLLCATSFIRFFSPCGGTNV